MIHQPHKLRIISFNDAQAHCDCDRWSFTATGLRTREEITAHWRMHIRPTERYPFFWQGTKLTNSFHGAAPSERQEGS